MPSKIPTYSVFPNNSPDTDYEQDYETPAPGPPPTRLLFQTGHGVECCDHDDDHHQTGSSRNSNPAEHKYSLHSASLGFPL